MPFPLPTPQELARRQEARLEAAIQAARPDASPQAIARAVRSPRGVLAAIARVQAEALYGLHLHLRWWGDQYFPDTAEAEFLDRHGDIWGIHRRAATRAVGMAQFLGEEGTTISAGFKLRSPTGVILATTEAGTVPLSGSMVLPVKAAGAGPEGNLDPETGLAMVSPIGGIEAIALDAEGMAGGAAAETDAGLLARLLERIQEPPHGGAAFDYPVWVQNLFPAARVRTLPGWLGPGTVGVAIAMGTRLEPRAPLSAELAEIAAHLETERPVTVADLAVLPVEIVPVDLTILVQPDELRVRGAVEAAVKTFFAREARIGEPLWQSRLSEAISAASGEYRHDLVAPAGNLEFDPRQLPVPGNFFWSQP